MRRSLAWLLLSTSAARFLVPLGLVLAAVAGSNAGWVGTSWDDSALRAGNAAGYVAFAVCAAAAVDSHRFRTQHPTSGTARRRSLAALLSMVLTAVLGWCCVAVLVGCSMTITGQVMAPRPWTYLLLVVPAGWVLQAATVGWLLGRLLHFAVAVPVSVLLLWVGNATLAHQSERTAMFSPIGGGVFTPSLVPEVSFVGMQVLSTLVSAVVAWSLVHLLTSRRRASRAVAGATAALAAVCLLISSTVVSAETVPRSVDVHDADGPKVCSGPGAGRVAVCVWPDDVDALDSTAVVAKGMWEPLATSGEVPQGVVDHGLARPPGWIDARLWYPDRPSLAEAIAVATTAWAWCGDSSARLAGVPFEEQRDRETWLMARHDEALLPVLSDEVQRVLDQPAAEQAAWFRATPAGLECLPR
ncbi:hypothetical protein [Auraticoccus monumenti]|uniref:Uncharacterized protein n=1 Tax=Auraticoccus monumenti TaxID=675864 RepID=A0A1G6Z608_9ACTN|nr:hypothetical protein [Auraticoccus monumenti]SDD98109.1 hypothetical protein SAMN04489747_2200 [Auraticoccus monumenti]